MFTIAATATGQVRVRNHDPVCGSAEQESGVTRQKVFLFK